jgi:purine catabolism regulator
MPVALRALIGSRGLDLAVRDGADALDRAADWVHVSELVNPRPFLEAGNLLLITGPTLHRGRNAKVAYVERLAVRNVAGPRFGIGLTREQVPATLIAAPDEAGLPVMEGPGSHRSSRSVSRCRRP